MPGEFAALWLLDWGVCVSVSVEMKLLLLPSSCRREKVEFACALMGAHTNRMEVGLESHIGKECCDRAMCVESSFSIQRKANAFIFSFSHIDTALSAIEVARSSTAMITRSLSSFPGRFYIFLFNAFNMLLSALDLPPEAS